METMTFSYIGDLAAMMPTIPENSIVSRTVYKDDQLKAVLFGFDAGQSLSEHTASQFAIIHILEGEATLTLGHEVKEAAAGTWIHMPPHLRHSVRAKTRLMMLLLLVAPC